MLHATVRFWAALMLLVAACDHSTATTEHDAGSSSPDVQELPCTPSSDPPRGTNAQASSFVLRRGFIYKGANDTELIHDAARLNALETFIYLSSLGLPVELPLVTVSEVTAQTDGLWVEYEASAPAQPDAELLAATYDVPDHPHEVFQRIIHGEYPECLYDELYFFGLQSLIYLLESGYPECAVDPTPVTAALSIEPAAEPQGRPFPAYQRFFPDCLLDILMVFNRLFPEYSPDDYAFQDHWEAESLLSDPNLAIGTLEKTSAEQPFEGVEVATYEGDCRDVGGATCVTVRVTLVVRNLDHEDQMDTETPSLPFILERMEKADIIYWASHGFLGLAHEGVTALPSKYQLMVLAQCSSASNYSYRFFSMKPGRDEDLDLIGFGDLAESTDSSAAALLEAILVPGRTGLLELLDRLNADREEGEEPFRLVGSLASPRENP